MADPSALAPTRSPFFPTARQELLLKAALGEGQPAVAAWKRWTDQLHGGVDHDPASFRLLPLLYRKLSAAGVDAAQLGPLKQAYLYAWQRNEQLLRTAEEVLRAFHDAGIPTLVLKGVALLRAYYGDNGVRPMGDLDVLVPLSRAEDAAQTLTAAGWEKTAPYPMIRLRVTQQAVLFVDPAGRQVDLHWQALYLPGQDDDFWSGSVPLTVRGQSARTLCAADHVLHLVVHGTDTFGFPTWAADVVTILQRTGDGFDWERLEHAAVDRGVTVRVARALQYLQAAFGISVPADVLDRLRAERPTLSERAALLVLDHPPRRPGAIYLQQWDRWRRLRQVQLPEPVPVDFTQYITWCWREERRRNVLRGALQAAARGVRSSR